MLNGLLVDVVFVLVSIMFVCFGFVLCVCVV